MQGQVTNIALFFILEQNECKNFICKLNTVRFHVRSTGFAILQDMSGPFLAFLFSAIWHRSRDLEVNRTSFLLLF